MQLLEIQFKMATAGNFHRMIDRFRIVLNSSFICAQDLK